MEHDISDAELIRLYLARDNTAVELTMKKYGSRLLHFALGFLGDERDAEECVNDAYLKAWDSIPPHEPADLYAYLARICRFTAYDMIEKRNTVKRGAMVVELTHEMEECIPDTSSKTDLPSAELTSLLNGFLGTLKRDDRSVFIRRYWFGESVSDIAGRFGFSESKVKTSLHRTREKLKKYLIKKGVYL